MLLGGGRCLCQGFFTNNYVGEWIILDAKRVVVGNKNRKEISGGVFILNFLTYDFFF